MGKFCLFVQAEMVDIFCGWLASDYETDEKLSILGLLNKLTCMLRSFIYFCCLNDALCCYLPSEFVV